MLALDEETHMSQEKTIPSRRKFLLALGASGAAGAAAVVGTTVPRTPPAASGNKKSGGYHLSEHIRNYYRTTKV